jgi:transcriptional regulator with XRE-family HTH domain
MDGNGTARAGYAAELARRRAEAGLSLADVATTAHVARGYAHHVEHARRWPSLAVARALDAALAAEGALLILWRAGDAARRAAHTGRAVATSHSQSPEHPHGALVSAADESAHYAAAGWALTLLPARRQLCWQALMRSILAMPATPRKRTQRWPGPALPPGPSSRPATS